MTRSIAQAEVLDPPWIQQSTSTAGWVWKAILALLFVSLFLLVYVNFANRVNTAKLNRLIKSGQELQVIRDQILLDKEKLQMHHNIERKAEQIHGFKLAKKAKVVNINI